MVGPTEFMLLPMLPPTEIFPDEFDNRGPRFPKIGLTPIPGIELRLPAEVAPEEKPGIEPPSPFILLPKPGFPTTLMAPLSVIPECPCEICMIKQLVHGERL